MVENGADIHANDEDALGWASDRGFIEVVKYLVEKGANIHARDDYALCFSSQYGRIEVVKFLLNCDLIPVLYWRDIK